jgi:hypothetical protein
MRRLAAIAALALLAAPLGASSETPFEPSADSFADAAACKARLIRIVAEEQRQAHVAVAGPYDVAPGDVRAHWIDASGSGHRITEHRCLAEKLSGRSWRHDMGGIEAEAPETIETMAAKAEWLKKAPGQQK